ncbi:unnamed protein product [Caenorhabditis auriculariae]|uniref:DZANK-type domain-containing protein n=1 Tax=Caenorhabditis auriculariae TaxID=2777116 RepID=A0A8S1GTJ2_9PELO|nr:unnamed protein product [Caenorhabditis auriculariae]
MSSNPGQNVRISSSTTPGTIIPCYACSAIPPHATDTFCRSCGVQLSLECSSCHNRLRPLDRYCPSCGRGRLVLVERIRRFMVSGNPAVVFLASLFSPPRLGWHFDMPLLPLSRR